MPVWQTLTMWSYVGLGNNILCSNINDMEEICRADAQATTS